MSEALKRRLRRLEAQVMPEPLLVMIRRHCAATEPADAFEARARSEFARWRQQGGGAVCVVVQQ